MFKSKILKKGMFFLLTINLSLPQYIQSADFSEFVSEQDLVWRNTVDDNYFNGAFIGDGIQGAMIMEDDQNPNGIRMLMGHYKAISHYMIPDLEYTVSRVYAGSITISPVSKVTTKDMRLNLWDGEASGVLTTKKTDKITWQAIDDRKHLVFVVVMKGSGQEANATLKVREEWGISPTFYLQNIDPYNFSEHIPPKPVLSKVGDVDIVINKMKTKGAHVVASKLQKEQDGTQILYVAIGVDDSSDLNKATKEAQADAIARVEAASAEGYKAIIERHRDWWHSYYQTSSLEIEEDSFWQQYWWLQIYKFASASSQISDFIIDTQGPWVYKSSWAAIWWNLNVQLSYMPMYSSNKLDAGRSLINGMNRIYKSGVLHENAKGVGITLPRGTIYDGAGQWGDEFGNLPWVLHCYWKYWKYSGDNEIAKDLYPMLKDNAVFLMSILEKEQDGRYHVVPSRSPEYSESLHRDANYALMSIRWVLQTLLEMNEEFGYNDEQSQTWKDHLDNLADYPIDSNGLRVNKDQGFKQGHRHYSHLLAIYPYHTLNPEQGTYARNLIKTSLNRWQSLTLNSGYQGYTFSGGCSMYAVLGDGNKALSTLNYMRSKKLTQPNTMYRESGGTVVETPLSVVESINYMLLQSWGGVVRIYPAVPDKWKNIAFRDFRTEGAFLVSAKYNNGIISDVSLISERGNICAVLNPWQGYGLVVMDETGDLIDLIRNGEKYTFTTEVGKKYFLHQGDKDSIIGEEANLRIYPNPVKDKLFIEDNERMYDKITISDLSGKTFLIQPLKVQKSEIPISLPSGLYVLTLSKGKTKKNVKLIVK
ncbi:alpha-L-fucosidase 2 [Dysgonomonas sp. PH5-45]|uniref:glycosyl hydrolase family 95 catalytic domain-containing protein n=1 Tax=unclassified Dysgonomonas TaxID=2630389 RepID=UPI002476E1D0|nr:MULTISPECIES: T9SS type A sorting domain-containing protein [unclassified Dysgonomonas]MDH6354279.1 alpha-L-fucosidase 2 [Dysgonomonas sp. PH5-45]MDH6387180.1 alpha-L-fucosidase 2 [Dysgonomonas sp. PH5-37]